MAKVKFKRKVGDALRNPRDIIIEKRTLKHYLKLTRRSWFNAIKGFLMEDSYMYGPLLSAKPKRTPAGRTLAEIGRRKVPSPTSVLRNPRETFGSRSPDVPQIAKPVECFTKPPEVPQVARSVEYYSKSVEVPSISRRFSRSPEVPQIGKSVEYFSKPLEVPGISRRFSSSPEEPGMIVKRLSTSPEVPKIAERFSRSPEVPERAKPFSRSREVPPIAKTVVFSKSPDRPQLVKPVEFSRRSPEVPQVATPMELVFESPEVECAKPVSLRSPEVPEVTPVSRRSPEVPLFTTPMGLIYESPEVPDGAKPVSRRSPEVPEITTPVSRNSRGVPQLATPMELVSGSPEVPEITTPVSRRSPEVPEFTTPGSRKSPEVPEVTTPVSRKSAEAPEVDTPTEPFSGSPQVPEVAKPVEEALHEVENQSENGGYVLNNGHMKIQKKVVTTTTTYAERRVANLKGVVTLPTPESPERRIGQLKSVVTVTSPQSPMTRSMDATGDTELTEIEMEDDDDQESIHGNDHAPLEFEVAEKVASDLIERLGGRFSSDLGIHVDASDAEVERWFLAANLFSASLSPDVSKNTYEELMAAGVSTLSDVLNVEERKLAEILERTGYTKRGQRVAAQFHKLAAHLESHNWGRVSTFKHTEDPDELIRELRSLPGVKLSTARCFMRELRGVWTGCTSGLETRTKRAAVHLKLLSSAKSALDPVEALTRVSGEAGIDIRDLETACFKLGVEHERDYKTCQGGSECNFLTSSERFLSPLP